MTTTRICMLLSALIISATVRAIASPLRITGSSHQIVAETPEASTGLDQVLVLFDTRNCKAVYTASSASSAVTWQTFGYLGAAHAEDVPPGDITRSGREVTLNHLQSDMGYAVTENGSTYYFWVVDYSRHQFDINAMYFPPEQNCDRTFIATEGSAGRITYYSINGRACTLSRGIQLSYTTLVPDYDNMRYSQENVTEELQYIESTINIAPPLCNTSFHLSGDRFLRQWGMERDITSPMFTAEAVSAIVKAEKTVHTADNEIGSDENLGGSAPVEITFTAIPTDAAIFTEWQMSDGPDFEDITYSNSSPDFTHTFHNMGTSYIRFMAANASGTCEYFSETFTVNIGESRLSCPNAFSPQGSPGVNDEWKVSYKSIIRFECYIFNRWGEKMTEFHDPSQGWDGRHGGKFVPAGVYYYVIKATGADGKEYDLSGDINIVNYKN